MISKINFLKIGDKKHHFSEANIPSLIHYKCKTGGSNYSMKLIENLALQGSKILIFTGFSEAKEQFYKETKAVNKQTVIVGNKQEIEKNKNKQIIIIKDADENLCLGAIKTLKDIKERVIFIKNIDIVHKKLLNECLKYEKIILSGDLDVCTSKENILKKKYNSVILFSQPKIKLPYKFINLEQYTGYIRSKNKEGYVKTKE